MSSAWLVWLVVAWFGPACADEKACPEHLLRQSPCVNVVWANVGSSADWCDLF